MTIKRRFIDINGIDFIVHQLKIETDQSLRKKLLGVLDDLALYDTELGGPETLLMVEQDKNILKGKASSHIVVKRPEKMTEEEKEAEEEPSRLADHSEYLHITKKQLFSSTFLADFASQLSNVAAFAQQNDEESRALYCKLAKLVLLYGQVHKLQATIDVAVCFW